MKPSQPPREKIDLMGKVYKLRCFSIPKLSKIISKNLFAGDYRANSIDQEGKVKKFFIIFMEKNA